MKFLRRIVRNGNSSQVSIPRNLMDYLRWREGDPIIVELTEDMAILVRTPNVTDLRSTPMPMTLDVGAAKVEA
jgi:antitoxin component of MazEF toxin-antitoxin module